jgi:DNA repair protein RadC
VQISLKSNLWKSWGLGGSVITKLKPKPRQLSASKLAPSLRPDIAESDLDCELLERIISRSASATQSALIAMRLISNYGTLAAVLKAPSIVLKYGYQVPDDALDEISIWRSVVQKVATAPLRESAICLDRPNIDEYLAKRFSWNQTSELILLLFNSSNRLIKEHLMDVGTTDQVNSCSREVMSAVLTSNAGKFVMAHNISSIERLNWSTVNLTKNVKKSAEMFEIHFMDHVIVCPGANHSMKDMGLLD